MVMDEVGAGVKDKPIALSPQGHPLEMVFNRCISVTGGKNVILIVKDINLLHS